MGSLTTHVPVRALLCEQCADGGGKHTFKDNANYYLVDVPVEPSDGGEMMSISLNVRQLRWRTQRNGYCTVEAVMTLACPECKSEHQVYSPLDAPLTYLQTSRRCHSCRSPLTLLDNVIDYTENEDRGATLTIVAVMRCPLCTVGEVTASQGVLSMGMDLATCSRLAVSLGEESITLEGSTFQDRVRTGELQAAEAASLLQFIEPVLSGAESEIHVSPEASELARASHQDLNIEERTVPSEPGKLKIFLSYAHKDEDLKAELEQRLKVIGRDYRIECWSDRQILAGAPVHDEILKRLQAADVILLLISPAFVASDYCWTREMEIALEQYERAGKLPIPIIVRRTPAWHESKIGRHLALPKDGRPLSTWPDADEFWGEVEEGLRRLIRHHLGRAD